MLESIASINLHLIKFEGFETQDILDQIECVKQLDPGYDASGVRKIFNYRQTDAILKRHPDLKLRLFVEMENEKDKDRFVKNGRQHLIDHLELQSGYALKFALPSVRELIVTPTTALNENLALLPNVTNVALTKCRIFDPNAFEALLRVEAFEETEPLLYYWHLDEIRLRNVPPDPP